MSLPTSGTLLPNGTYTGGHVSHIGQLYFDASLRAVVEAAEPCNTNLLPPTTNKEDVWIGPSKTEQDGILAWTSMTVDAGANWDAVAGPAAYWGEDGGHDNSDGGWAGMFPTRPAKK
ncbi:hypothetical protein VC83_07725 [Pseudogymnoascus destructans]|uniref:Uncharacterized protein n=2 Tax=Pseudogymnoascus destructans TaxID=655981 RepID=L8FW94_PSED2|nr:uncharacterized protein VC83_07725 [Pseudogymnoascus destructans]ELR05220.1 hypothetical protein GMDG_01658 [Pseudogymnoascus destructans 20631-21]OAF55540.1 hypothetical protein VC83_07725 [Pseudogymnoascus destructans]